MKRVFKKLLLAIICAISLLGCSKSGDVTAPSTTVITISPDDTSLSSLLAPANIPYKALVTDENGEPLNEIKLYITGTFAAPYNGGAYYQFYSDKACSNPVNSGFEGKTDKFGVYEFCVKVTGAAFDDKNGITVSSGTAIATASLKVE